MTLTSPAPTTRTTPSVSASWAPPVAWGAGLVLAALGAGGIISRDAGALSRGIGVALVAVGLGCLVWGAIALSQGRIVLPRIATGGAVLGMLLAGALLAAAPARTSAYAVATALVMLIAVALVTGRASRSGPASSRPANFWMLLAAAALVALLVTPALGAVQNALLVDANGVLPEIPGHNH